MLIEQLEELVKSAVPTISSAASKALEAKELFQSRMVSVDEYFDLIDDITRLDNINKEMETELMYISIINAYKLISELKALTL